MKRFLICLICAMLLLLPAFALADVISEDEYDAFYLSVSDECEPFNDHVLANGKEGYVATYEKPNSNRAYYYILNGQRIYVQAIYKDWALLDYFSGGWIKLSETIEDDLSEEFFRQHESECMYPEPAATLNVSGLNVIYWEYPGSKVNDLIYDLTCLSANTNETPSEELVSVLTFDCTWEDADGRIWGYSRDGFMFTNGGWVCITDPTNGGFVFETLKVEGMIPAIEESELPKPYVEPALWLKIVYAVAGVVVLAVILIIIIVFSGRRKHRAAAATNEANPLSGDALSQLESEADPKAESEADDRSEAAAENKDGK